MELLPLHPMVVHFPIALILLALLFDVIGRATDLSWWRKAAFAMLLLGVVAAFAALRTGDASEDLVREQGNVPHEAVEQHEAAGIFTWWMGLIAVAARVLETRAGVARGAISMIALVAHLLTAAGVSVAGYRGGILVYDHGAGVRAQTMAAPSDVSGEDDSDGGDEEDDD